MTKAVWLALLALVLQAQAPPGAVADLTSVSIVTGANTTGLYHRDGCAWLKDAPVQRFTVGDANARHFQPHCLCMTGKDGRPPCEAATTGGASAGAHAAAPVASTPAAPLSAVSPATPAPARPAASTGRCQAITKKGAQCTRAAQPGRAFCWQH